MKGSIVHFLKYALMATVGVFLVTYLVGLIPGVRPFIKSIFSPA